jgi:hypothetical protein
MSNGPTAEALGGLSGVAGGRRRPRLFAGVRRIKPLRPEKPRPSPDA